MNEKKTDWVPVLVTCIVFLFATSILLYAVSENRKSDNEYFKGRLATLESRMNQQDKRLDSLEESIKKINTDIKEITTLTIQINANVIENSKKIDDLIQMIQSKISQYENDKHNPVPCGHYKTAVSVLKELQNVG